MARQIEVDHAIPLLGPVADEFDRIQVALVEGPIQRLDLRIGDDFFQARVLHPPDDLLHNFGAFGGFDDQRQFHRRSSQFHCRAGVRVLSAVDDQRPLDQFAQIRRGEAKALAGHVRDERGAGFIARVVKLASARVAAELFGIRAAEEGALVMIEPPGEARVIGVFEIYDGVFVAIEQIRREDLRGPVGHACIAEFRIRVNRPRDETAEEGSRRCPVETMVVVEHPY